MTAQLTKHGIKRVKERMGTNKRAVERIANKALNFGIGRNDVSGSLRKLLDSIKGEDRTLKIYNNKIFVFSQNTLITILNISQKYSTAINKINKKKVHKMLI